MIDLAWLVCLCVTWTHPCMPGGKRLSSLTLLRKSKAKNYRCVVTCCMPFSSEHDLIEIISLRYYIGIKLTAVASVARACVGVRARVPYAKMNSDFGYARMNAMRIETRCVCVGSLVGNWFCGKFNCIQRSIFRYLRCIQVVQLEAIHSICTLVGINCICNTWYAPHFCMFQVAQQHIYTGDWRLICWFIYTFSC